MPGRFYLRFNVEDRPGVMAEIAGILGRHDISIASVIQHETDEEENRGTVPLVIMTHLASEGSMGAAMEEIGGLASVGAGDRTDASEELNEASDEIRDHHSRRLRRRTADLVGRQDAAGGGPAAGHGCRGGGGRGGPGNARARVDASRAPTWPISACWATIRVEHFTGRAPLEAAAQGIELGPDDWAVRCNLVTIEDQVMRDFTAGHISTAEAAALLATAQERLGNRHLQFYPGVSYRNLLVYRAAEGRRRFRPTRAPPRRTT